MSPEMNTNLQKSLNRFSGILSDREIEEILTIQTEPLPTGIRLNSLKIDPQAGIQGLADRYNWKVKPIPFCDHAWTILSAAQSPGTTIEHRMGEYYLQDAASMVPVSLFKFDQPHPLILDMAASPGGKTTHLIDRTGDRGFIIANDSSKSRIPALRSVLTTWGGVNQIITQYPGERFGDWYPETFDIVLLDAPCSMENLRPTDNRPPRETSSSERHRLQERQVQLLKSALSALKVGGQLVYATCSLAPEEDEAVIQKVIDAFPDTFTIQDLAHKLPFDTPGLTRFGEIVFHPDLSRTARLWPHLTGMSGFFCGLLTKTQSVPNQAASPPSRDFSKTLLQPANSEIERSLINSVRDQYGFEMDNILTNFDLALYKRYESLFLVPETYLYHFSDLPFAHIGMAIGKLKDDQFQPSHEFASRFGHFFTSGKIILKDEDVSQWISGRDIRNPHTNLNPQGQYLLVNDHLKRNLGIGKLLPGRLRNMLFR